MVTPYTPAVAELKEHDTGAVLLADRLTGVVGQVTVNPVAGLIVGVRVTEPAKLFTPVKVIDIEAPMGPVLKLTDAGAEIWKSPTCTVTPVDCVIVPGELEPVIVTV